MKKKTCFWLNSKECGSLVLRHGSIKTCCTRELLLIDNSFDYQDLTYDFINKKRFEFLEKMNDKNSACKGCGFLHETEEKNIEISQLEYLIYHPHLTCNLRCCYCPYVKDGSVNNKFDREKYNPLKLISHFHEIGMFKDTINFEFGGGEPLMLDNIPEAVDFLSEYYPKATAIFVSNFSLKKQANDLINVLKNRKIRSILKTSIDCGTRETYKKIRGQDLFETVYENILNAARNTAFDEIMLKYIFLEDKSNASKKDIQGFINLVKRVKEVNPNKTTVILDADITSVTKSKFEKDILSEKILRAAGKIYGECNYKLKCEIKWLSERFSPSRPNGIKHIEKIKNYAKLFYLTKLLKIVLKLIF